MKIKKMAGVFSLLLSLAIINTMTFSFADDFWNPPIEKYKNIAPWYVTGIQEAIDWQIMPERFTKLPMDGAITRGEFAEALVLAYARATGTLPEEWNPIRFTDQPNAYAQVASELGLVSGYVDDTYRSNGEIKREELFVMLNNLMKKLENPEMLSELGDEVEQDLLLADFADADKISVWAKTATATMVKHKVVTGTDKGTIDPKKVITRAQAMVVLTRGIQAVVAQPVSTRDSNGALYEMYKRVKEMDSSNTDPSEVPATTEEDNSNTSRGGYRRSYSIGTLYTPEEMLVMLGNNPVKYALIFGSETAERFQTAEASTAHLVMVTVDVWTLNQNGTKSTAKRSFTVHAALAETFKLIFKEIYEGEEQFPIKNIGGYAWRPSSTSEHRWGLAVDINSNENYMIRKDGTVVSGSFWLPSENPYSIKPDGDVVRAFKKYGFSWGGDAWPMSNDYMHFSFLGE